MAISNAFNAKGGTKYNAPISFEYPVENVTTKTINHRFDHRPHVFIVDENGYEVQAEIRFVSSSQLLINFVISFTGIIILR